MAFILVDVTMAKRTEQRHNAIGRFRAGRARVMLSDIRVFVQPLLTGLGCVTTQAALVTDQGQADRK